MSSTIPATRQAPEDAEPTAQPKEAHAYLRLRFKPFRRPALTVWAVKVREGIKGGCLHRVYRQADDEGGLLDRYIIAASGDVIYEKPARINLHYGKLEVSEASSPESAA